MRVVRILVDIYGTACLVGLAIMAIGTFGLFGAEPDPISAVYAILLAMPWSLALSYLNAPIAAFAILLSGMALNLIIIMAIGRAIARFGARA